ncbi:hypothetical protein DAPPUDRAFT_99234 [Daphnia pulex]|uniref:Uncharacterized protein n=1 Tax=Daphnia pulex TaxID=6669 RepID=E9G638_DAPPU|nr:hypothetical protein DAPPUDRAFT_99234 [Daphnia pulex]|eukprot:EFX85060.1 hypothetical protein DAPPUDRAFT_99234 [Daphnia pulex]
MAQKKRTAAPVQDYKSLRLTGCKANPPLPVLRVKELRLPPFTIYEPRQLLPSSNTATIIAGYTELLPPAIVNGNRFPVKRDLRDWMDGRKKQKLDGTKKQEASKQDVVRRINFFFTQDSTSLQWVKCG